MILSALLLVAVVVVAVVVVAAARARTDGLMVGLPKTAARTPLRRRGGALRVDFLLEII